MLVVSLPARFPLQFLMAFALGALHAAAFVDDAAWPIEIAALAGLVALVMRAAREMDGRVGRRRAIVGGARTGFAFGLGWFGVGVSWIYISLHTYGELAAPLAALAVFAFCAYLSLFPALACAVFAAFRHARATAPGSNDGGADRVASVLLFAAAWAASEWARGTFLTGFPWLAAGYAHVAGPLAGYAPVAGVYGVSLMAAAIAAAVAVGARRRPRARGPALTFLLAVVLGVPLGGDLLGRASWTTPVGDPIAVRLLQGNVAQDIKFDEAHFDSTVDAYLDAIDGVDAKHADLVVLPETAFPVFLADLPPAIAARLAHAARTGSMDIAFGIPIEEPGDRYFNSVLAIGPPTSNAPTPSSATIIDDLPAQRYDKSHIVPFGEFVPTGFHWFMRLVNIPLGDFTRGATTQQPMTLAGLRIAFNICYEDLFGEEIIRQATVANVLINVSNVAWFGDSMALPQHLGIGRMRALETGRPMLRATNTGMTAAIDPHGHVDAVLKPFTSGALDVTVQGTTGTTPYVAVGNHVVGGLILLCLAIALVLVRGVAGTALRARNDRVR